MLPPFDYNIPPNENKPYYRCKYCNRVYSSLAEKERCEQEHHRKRLQEEDEERRRRDFEDQMLIMTIINNSIL